MGIFLLPRWIFGESLPIVPCLRGDFDDQYQAWVAFYIFAATSSVRHKFPRQVSNFSGSQTCRSMQMMLGPGSYDGQGVHRIDCHGIDSLGKLSMLENRMKKTSSNCDNGSQPSRKKMQVASTPIGFWLCVQVGISQRVGSICFISKSFWSEAGWCCDPTGKMIFVYFRCILSACLANFYPHALSHSTCCSNVHFVRDFPVIHVWSLEGNHHISIPDDHTIIPSLPIPWLLHAYPMINHFNLFISTMILSQIPLKILQHSPQLPIPAPAWLPPSPGRRPADVPCGGAVSDEDPRGDPPAETHSHPLRLAGRRLLGSWAKWRKWVEFGCCTFMINIQYSFRLFHFISMCIYIYTIVSFIYI